MMMSIRDDHLDGQAWAGIEYGFRFVDIVTILWTLRSLEQYSLEYPTSLRQLHEPLADQDQDAASGPAPLSQRNGSTTGSL